MTFLIERLRTELNSFWQWAGLTIEEYKNNGEILYSNEICYPNYIKLQELVFEAIIHLKNGENSKELVELILEFIAIDNEDEVALDLCEAELADAELQDLAEYSVHFPLYNARWQIAELIGRRTNESFIKYLLLFVNDDNKYVQRRALLSLTRISPEKAEKEALSKLRDEDDYLRMVALKILRELSSEYLSDAIDILKDDNFKYIQLEIDDIRNEDINFLY